MNLQIRVFIILHLLKSYSHPACRLLELQLILVQIGLLQSPNIVSEIIESQENGSEGKSDLFKLAVNQTPDNRRFRLIGQGETLWIDQPFKTNRLRQEYRMFQPDSIC